MATNLFSNATVVDNVVVPYIATTGTSKAIEIAKGLKSFQLTSRTGTAGTTVAVIEGSNDGTNYVTLGTISVSTAGSDAVATDGFTSFCAWKLIRARVTTLTGTNPQVKVWVK